MKKLLLFDVDGTITESGQILDESMCHQIQSMTPKYDIGIVGGGKMEKIIEQLGPNNYFHHYFSECGCVYYKNKSVKELKLELQYIKNIRHHELYNDMNLLVKKCLSFLSNVDYQVSGHFIDLRNGIIYVSLIGMSATLEERKNFMDLDKKHNYRESLLELLKNETIRLDLSTKISICQGGSVGIAIYPQEYDKIQVLEHLIPEYQEIHYFGDKYHKNGNDYHLIRHPNVIGHPVDGIQDTKLILNEIKKIDF